MKYSFSDRLKLISINCQRIIRKIIRHSWFIITCFIWLLSIIIFFIVLGLNVSHKIPLVSYWVEESRLPISLTLNGYVEVYDTEKKLVDSEITISIGGYSKSIANNTGFELNYNSSTKEDIPVLIEYECNGDKLFEVIYITYSEKEFALEEEFVVSE